MKNFRRLDGIMVHCRQNLEYQHLEINNVKNLSSGDRL